MVKSEAEALLLESQLIKKYKPRYNTDFTDDKRFLLVRVDLRETLPRFRLTRNRIDGQSRHYGPFAHSGHLRKTLSELRRKFGILLSDAKLVELGDGRWRLYDDARAEIYDHPNEITAEDYRLRMDAACVNSSTARHASGSVNWSNKMAAAAERATTSAPPSRRHDRRAEAHHRAHAQVRTQLTSPARTTTLRSSSACKRNCAADPTEAHGVL